MIPMAVRERIFTQLRHMQSFTIELIMHQIHSRLAKEPREWTSFFDRRMARIDSTVDYAIKEHAKAGGTLSKAEIAERTGRSLDAELGIAYILGGLTGVMVWLDNDDITFDVPTPDFNLEIKTSFNRWPTMHTAGAEPYGRADGLCLYAGYKGNADVFLVLHMENVDGQTYFNPNYFFTKRAMEKYPYEIATRRMVDGAYINRNHDRYVHFYKKWCTL
ncbi:hypothetical protein 44RRORF250c [Aeromonas phage 44RR2.8t]|uniref:Uncharacterized protein n=2 Tax=Biquartavirus 44RR2 TaxID=115987 RepID=Q6U952_9CAUD|nr:DenB-like DNA endonuclease IV [Aeromonas phage 44RR2.8t]AAQ81568.1 hypothetical protein 44RRORF250c [Aeromonas phage 44RR2.8t]APU00723.1 hypothetical protein [Aeromonas phage 44RR2.8t.2]